MPKSAALRQLWEERIAHFRASSQSVTVWCDAHQLKTHQLRYWLRQLSQESTPSTSLTPHADWIAFPWDVTDDLAPPLLVHVGAAVIEVAPGFDPRLLAEVVRTLSPQ